jgi:hypothetical protein
VQKTNLPGLSAEAMQVVSELGFRSLSGMTHMFVGKATSQNPNADPYIVILQIMPLQIDRNRYVISLTYNGNEAFKTRLGSLDDLVDWFKTYAVYEDIDAFVRGDAK